MSKRFAVRIGAFALFLANVVLASSACMAEQLTPTLRGVNKVHWDQTSAGIYQTEANVIRFALDFTKSAEANYTLVKRVPHRITPIVGNWAATCKQDEASLSSVVDTWIDQSKFWTRLDGIINIANEWGPRYIYQERVSPWRRLPQHGWRDAYIKAIKRMREAGYRNTLMIDAGGCGQDWQDIANDGADVLAADPLHKIIFDLHIYGSLDTDAKLDAAFAGLSASHLPIFVGEFGPGAMIGPSKTPITPQNIVARAEAAHFGWAAWAWDDNDMAACKSDDNWFSMTRFCSHYDGSPNDLTKFGQVIVPLLASLNRSPRTASPGR